MFTHVIRKTRDPYYLLERALNKTSLTTKQVAHGHILGRPVAAKQLPS